MLALALSLSIFWPTCHIICSRITGYPIIDTHTHRKGEQCTTYMTWVNFRARFLEKYFPDSAIYERETKFLTLQQETMTVQAYTDRFEYLARFYSQTVNEEWHCRKFEGDLNNELRRFLVPLRIWEFPVLVEQAKMVEQLERGPSRVMRAHPKNSISGEKWQEKPYTRPQREGRGTVKCF